MIVIKKYPNRRLYDTSDSRYITLEDLAERIRAGADVLVQDAQSGADLTQSTLTQIILESRGGARLLPVPLLVRLIRMGDEALAEFLGRYVSWALEMYIQAKQGARALMPLNPLATAPFAATDALARLVLGASQWAQGGRGQAAPIGAPPQSGEEPNGAPPMPIPTAPPDEEPAFEAAPRPAGPSQVAEVADEMARLRREIEALKRSFGGSSAPASRPSKKPAAKKPAAKKKR